MRRAGHGALAGPVVVYFAAIAAMVASAIASGNAWAIAGAALFLVSDSLIAESRFVAPRRGVGPAIMVTYHLALAGLVLSLL
jgi:alkenylglycerophosphocholine/alkenylglycerophosphoethanolamine hydrolase